MFEIIFSTLLYKADGDIYTIFLQLMAYKLIIQKMLAEIIVFMSLTMIYLRAREEKFKWPKNKTYNPIGRRISGFIQEGKKKDDPYDNWATTGPIMTVLIVLFITLDSIFGFVVW